MSHSYSWSNWESPASHSFITSTPHDEAAKMSSPFPGPGKPFLTLIRGGKERIVNRFPSTKKLARYNNSNKTTNKEFCDFIMESRFPNTIRGFRKPGSTARFHKMK